MTNSDNRGTKERSPETGFVEVKIAMRQLDKFTGASILIYWRNAPLFVAFGDILSPFMAQMTSAWSQLEPPSLGVFLLKGGEIDLMPL